MIVRGSLANRSNPEETAMVLYVMPQNEICVCGVRCFCADGKVERPDTTN